MLNALVSSKKKTIKRLVLKMTASISKGACAQIMEMLKKNKKMEVIFKAE